MYESYGPNKGAINKKNYYNYEICFGTISKMQEIHLNREQNNIFKHTLISTVKT